MSGIPTNNGVPFTSLYSGNVLGNTQGLSQVQEDRIRCIEFQLTTFSEAITKIYDAYMLGDTYDSFRGALARNVLRIEQMQKMLVDFNTRLESLEFQIKTGGKRKRE